MQSQFSHVGNLQYEIMSLGMGSFDYSVMPPKKSRQGSFYPLMSFRNYKSNSYTNQDNMLNANIRYRIYGVVNIPSQNNGNGNGFETKSLTYGLYNEGAVRNAANEIANSMQQVNLWTEEYLNTATFNIPFSNDEVLSIQPTYININNNQAEGVYLSAGGNFITTCTRNTFESFIMFLLNNTIEMHRDSLILMYQNSQIQASLDALMVNAGIFAGVDYNSGSTSIIGGSNGMTQTNTNNNFGQPTQQRNSYSNNNFNNQFSNIQSNNNRPKSNAQTTPFGNGSGIRPAINSANHANVFGKVEKDNNIPTSNNTLPKKDEAPEVQKTSLDDLESKISGNTTPKQEAPKQEEKKPVGLNNKLAGFQPTGKFEDKVSGIVEEESKDNPFAGTDLSQFSSDDPFAGQ